MNVATIAPKYETYKLSGVPWLGEIPSHWLLERGKWQHKFNKQLNKRRVCENVLSLTLRGVVNNNPDDPEGLVPLNYDTYQIFEKDDLVFKLIDLENFKTSRVGLVHERGVMSSAYIRVTPSRKGVPRYHYYLYYSLYQQGVYNKIGAGVRSTLNPTDLLEISTLHPPRDEQDRIAAFLDQKTAEIDEAIARKQRLIDLLKEQKAILINQAVTKGLNPNVPMRDSGVEWIGEVPAHWEMKRVKNVSNFITSGPRGWADYFSDEGAVFLQSGNLTNSVGIDLNSANRVIPPRGAEGRRTRLKSKDVLVCITGANTGRVALAEIGAEEVYINQHLCLIRPRKNVYSSFLAYNLHSNVGKMHFFLRQYGLKEGLGLDDIKNAPVLAPPIEEQKMISAKVEGIMEMADHAVLNILEHIKALNEYKATLISEAVTGKIKI